VEAFGGEVQRAGARGERPALDLLAAQGVFGGDGGPHPAQPGGDPAVDAGPVQVRVHKVVAAAPDETGQSGQGREIRVAAHAEVGDRHPVRAQPVGHRTGIGQGHDVALGGEMTQQQPQLLFRAADAETGDDVQDPHPAPPKCTGPSAG
jgi:hypothetical protein